MKLTVPHYAVGPVMHALHDSSVGAVLKWAPQADGTLKVIAA